MADGVAKVNAFIGPSHVSVITGADIYLPIVDRYQVPVVVSGFEPVDVMEALLMMVRQKVEGRYALEVQYSRAVTASGNKAAQRLVGAFRDPRALSLARSGDINASALRLRDAFAKRDAERHFQRSDSH